jgi:3-deoxy-D-manno-octulosonic acid (KDO) 8-phosphate synthase
MKLCGFDVGLNRPLFLISGPCVVESEQLQLEVAGRLKEMTAVLGIPFIFKSIERHVGPRPGHGQGARDPRQGPA